MLIILNDDDYGFCHIKFYEQNMNTFLLVRFPNLRSGHPMEEQSSSSCQRYLRKPTHILQSIDTYGKSLSS